ncbi:MAG: acyl-CoA reductase [Bacteroidetes bacterium]|nr:acyl-CoA reductase [Bacteroidota bacterium]
MIEKRITILLKLKEYILSNEPRWLEIIEKAERQNAWFTKAFIWQAIHSISDAYLHEVALRSFALQFKEIEAQNVKTIGIVMAGNIPLVGFHDFLCVFLSGHTMRIKFSSKDDVILPHLIQTMYQWDETLRECISASEMLKGCDAYIATGSSNSARYFDYYFAKYPSIIRRNRTSVAVLDGSESNEELSLLADDVYQYFGLGCRNVTQLYVPEGYDFVPMLNAFKKYDELKHHNKFKNNYDYHLAILMLNRQYYMTNDSVILVEHDSVFSAISVVNYTYYHDRENVLERLKKSEDIQAIVGKSCIPFGDAQKPSLIDFADGVDTVAFLNSL